MMTELRTARERLADAVLPLMVQVVSLALGPEAGRLVATCMSRPPDAIVRSVEMDALRRINPSVPVQERRLALERSATPFLSAAYRRRWRRERRRSMRHQFRQAPPEFRAWASSLRGLFRSVPASGVLPKKLQEVAERYERYRQELIESGDLAEAFPLTLLSDRRARRDAAQEVGQDYEAVLQDLLWELSDPVNVSKMVASGEWEAMVRPLLRALGAPEDPQAIAAWVYTQIPRLFGMGAAQANLESQARELLESLLGTLIPMYALGTKHPTAGYLRDGGRRVVPEETIERTLEGVTSPLTWSRIRGRSLLSSLIEQAAAAYDERELAADLMRRATRMREIARSEREVQACEVFEAIIEPVIHGESPASLEEARPFPEACRSRGYTDANAQRSIRRALGRLWERTA